MNHNNSCINAQCYRFMMAVLWCCIALSEIQEELIRIEVLLLLHSVYVVVIQRATQLLSFHILLSFFSCIFCVSAGKRALDACATRTLLELKAVNLRGWQMAQCGPGSTNINTKRRKSSRDKGKNCKLFSFGNTLEIIWGKKVSLWGKYNL